LGLFARVMVAAARCHAAGLLAAEQTAWYEKQEPTFSDCLRLVRSRIWQARISRGSAEQADLIQLPRAMVDALIHSCEPPAHRLVPQVILPTPHRRAKSRREPPVAASMGVG
jgi:hypothetical protein